jgi:hypothetical protein
VDSHGSADCDAVSTDLQAAPGRLGGGGIDVLFVGQMTASVLFIAYSALMGSTVFVVTNTLILITAVVGQILAVRRRRRHS